MDSGAMSPAEVAQALGVSLPTVHRILASGELRSFKVLRARRITRAAVDEYIALHEAQVVPA